MFHLWIMAWCGYALAFCIFRMTSRWWFMANQYAKSLNYAWYDSGQFYGEFCIQATIHTLYNYVWNLAFNLCHKFVPLDCDLTLFSIKFDGFLIQVMMNTLQLVMKFYILVAGLWFDINIRTISGSYIYIWSCNG